MKKTVTILLALLGATMMPGLGAMEKNKREINRKLTEAVTRDDVATAEQALKDGADANITYHKPRAYTFNPILHSAHSSAMITLLLKYGADIDALNGPQTFNALILACENRNIDRVTLLLKKKANVNIRIMQSDESRINALYASCYATDQKPPTDISKSITALILLNPRTHGDEISHTYSHIGKTPKARYAIEVNPGLMLAHLDGVRGALHYATKARHDEWMHVLLNSTSLRVDPAGVVIQYLSNYKKYSDDIPGHPLKLDKKPTDDELEPIKKALELADEINADIQSGEQS